MIENDCLPPHDIQTQKKYIVKDGVLLSGALGTIKYGSQWTSTDNRTFSEEDGYIYYEGSCKNRSHGLIIIPNIINEQYTKLYVEFEGLYNGEEGKKHGVKTCFSTTGFGSENSGWIEEEMGFSSDYSAPGEKYYYAYTLGDPTNEDVVDNTWNFNIDGVSTIYLFVGFWNITNPDQGTIVKLYNIWLK